MGPDRRRYTRAEMAELPERRTPEEWDRMYIDRDVESMPWYLPTLDPDLDAALSRLGIRGGAAADLGTGPGTQAISLAERGFVVTGTDISPTAVARAKEAAKARRVSVTFVADDIRATKLTGPFDLIFDRGCLHVLPPERWERYTRTVVRLLSPGGWLFLKCFSALEPRETVPHRFTPAEIRSVFGRNFEICSIAETEYQGAKTPTPRALFCVLRKPPEG